MIRSRRRSVSLQLGSDGGVLVRAPYGMSEEEICRFVSAHEDWLARARARREAHLSRHPEPTPEQEAVLRRKAHEILPLRTAYWSARTGLTPTALHITSARTRFGSCSGKNSVNFSWRLMDYPMEAVDLVIVHELCHIRFHNHGKGFYRLLESVLPDYRERMKLLE